METQVRKREMLATEKGLDMVEQKPRQVVHAGVSAEYKQEGTVLQQREQPF